MHALVLAVAVLAHALSLSAKRPMYYLALKTAGESQNRSTRGRMPLLKLLCTDRQTDRQTVSATRRTLTWATRSRNSPSIFVCVCAVDVRTYDGSLAVVRPTRISRRASQSVSQGRKAVWYPSRVHGKAPIVDNVLQSAAPTGPSPSLGL